MNSIRKSSIFDPFQGAPLDLYFLSEIHLLDVSHSRRTNLDLFIAFADALPLHYLMLFSFAKIPCETSRIFGGSMSTSIAFAHDLSPICLTIFSFSNIPCGTSDILGGPISISIAFAHALIQLHLVLFTYCRFVSLCTRNPGFHSSNPCSARALRLSRFRPSFRIVLADVCGPECHKTSLCAVFAKIIFSPTPNTKPNTTKIGTSRTICFILLF